jgi:FkbM family methyltransferase
MLKSVLLKEIGRRGYRLDRVRSPWQEQRRVLGREASVVFDVGANCGDTVAAYRAVFPGAQIYAFEPFQPLVADLRTRFRSDPRVIVLDTAVSSNVGEATLHISTGLKTHSLLPRPAQPDPYIPLKARERGAVTVPLTTLDGFCQERGIRAVDVLKLDVEGAELSVMEGAKQLLAERRIGMLFLEIVFLPHYEDQPVYFTLLERLGRDRYYLYDVFDLKRDRRTGQLKYANVLVLPHES